MPIGPSTAHPPDLVRDAWLPVTVQVGWSLVAAGERVGDLLDDAREHVLRSLPADATVRCAERVSPALVADFLGRVRHGRFSACPVPPAPSTLPDAWRDQLLSALDPVGEAVFRLHFGDGLGFESIEAHLPLDRTTLVAARCGVRDLLRDVGACHSRADHEVDAMLVDLATRPAQGCPGPMGLLTDLGMRHADTCPRCSRAVRLLRGGHLQTSDLFAPRDETPLPDTRLSVFALLLHPDAGKHVRRVRQAIGSGALEVEPGGWIMDEETIEAALPGLARLCEDSRPGRHHLRGARACLPGRWADGVAVGPAPVAALDAARAKPWSELGSDRSLPAPLPPPPRATGWWVAAACALVLAGAATWATLRTSVAPPTAPVEAEFMPTHDGWSVRFDTSDRSVVDIIVLDGGGFRRLSPAARAGKGAWATGEGDFQLDVGSPRVAVLASPEGLPELDSWLGEAAFADDPFARLAQRVREGDPRADVVLSPARTAPEGI